MKIKDVIDNEQNVKNSKSKRYLCPLCYIRENHKCTSTMKCHHIECEDCIEMESKDFYEYFSIKFDKNIIDERR